MRKRISDYTPEEQERRRALSRERNKRYLAKHGERVKEQRYQNHKNYLAKLKSDASLAEKLEDRKKKAIERRKKWIKDNPEREKQNARKFRKKWEREKPHLAVAKTQRRNARKKLACPFWADHEAIANKYKEAQELSKKTGIKHHVDHIIPLRGKNVSGLHIAANLQVLTWLDNVKKHNKFEGVN